MRSAANIEQMSKKRSRLKPDEVPVLWADQSGKLNLSGVGVTEPRESSSRLLLLCRRAPRRNISPAEFWRLYSSWLLEISPLSGFPRSCSVGDFEKWLGDALDDSPVRAVGLAWVVRSGSAALGLDRDTLIKYLLDCTGRGGRFRSDGEEVTRR